MNTFSVAIEPSGDSLFKHNSSTSCSPLGIKSFQHGSSSKGAPGSPELFLSHSTVSLNSGMGQGVYICFRGIHTRHHCNLSSLHSTLYLIERYIKNCFFLIQTPSLPQSSSYWIFIINPTPCPCRPVELTPHQCEQMTHIPNPPLLPQTKLSGSTL